MSLPTPKIPLTLDQTSEKDEIVSILEGYRLEAEENRQNGLNPRDDKWRDNLNLYWNRFDFSDKAEWQAKETMPEVPSYVDRFAAALKEALVSIPDNFYSVSDPSDTEGDLTGAIKRATDAWLSTCGRSQLGHLLPFPAVFEEQMKLGALTACCGTVLWKDDVPGGRVAFDTVDPRFVWMDHTGRDLYRVRRVELDKIDLIRMTKATSANGKALFDLEQLSQMVSGINHREQADREEMSGHGHEVTSTRTPVTLDEYIASVVTADGRVVSDHGLFVVGNGRFLLRGPETNPFWHGKDWLVYAPLVTTPLSVYGRSYMEDFGALAKTFTDLTNLLLDAVQTSSMKAFAVLPSALQNPKQAAEGISPNKMFLLQDGYLPEQFCKELDLGTLDQGGVNLWQQIKTELSEAASINEIGLGQFAPNSRTSATEVSATQQSSSALIRSIAQTVETRFVDVVLDLVWKTGLQHLKPTDEALITAIGPEGVQMLVARRKDFIKRPITFRARGITSLIQRSQMLQSLLQLMQVVAQNENLMAAFMQKVDPAKLVDYLFNLSGVDPTKMTASARDQMIGQVLSPMMGQAAGGTPTPNGLAEMGNVTQSMGIGA